jgi:hypothetical protein
MSRTLSKHRNQSRRNKGQRVNAYFSNRFVACAAFVAGSDIYFTIDCSDCAGCFAIGEFVCFETKLVAEIADLSAGICCVFSIGCNQLKTATARVARATIRTETVKMSVHFKILNDGSTVQCGSAASAIRLKWRFWRSAKPTLCLGSLWLVAKMYLSSSSSVESTIQAGISRSSTVIRSSRSDLRIIH